MNVAVIVGAAVAEEFATDNVDPQQPAVVRVPDRALAYAQGANPQATCGQDRGHQVSPDCVTPRGATTNCDEVVGWSGGRVVGWSPRGVPGGGGGGGGGGRSATSCRVWCAHQARIAIYVRTPPMQP